MPKLYEYLGIIIMFYSEEHAPIHVHGKHGGRECKAEIIVRNGKVIAVRFKPVRSGLEPVKQKEFERFVRARADDIVQKWDDAFLRNKLIHPEIITKKI